MIRFSVLGSGSKGNATFFEVDGFGFLVDCGFTRKELSKRLKVIGRKVSDVGMMFLSHRHSDHVTQWIEINTDICTGITAFDGSVKVRPFSLSHDEPCVGYTIEDKDGNKVAIIPDTGCVGEEAMANLFGCQAILIECNYDARLLMQGSYSDELKDRVMSRVGHLRNECAAEVIDSVKWEGLKHVVAIHLSEKNNNQAFVKFCLESVSNGYEVIISDQSHPTRVVTII